MTIRVALHHKTVYHYDRAVAMSPHVVRLKPAPHCRTTIVSYSLKITPAAHFINWQQDPFGNYLARLVFPEKTREFGVEVELVADMTTINPFDFFIEEYAETFPFTYDRDLARQLGPYFEVEEPGPAFLAWMKDIDRQPKRTIDFLSSLNLQLQKYVNYVVRMEPGVQTCEETLTARKGSCRDSAWLLVQLLRHLGLAARFVSGYLVQLAADEKSLDGPSGPEQDFTDLHAWAEVYLPGAGWLGLDPTSGLFAGEGHIPLACTPFPSSAAPIEGATDFCQVAFSHENQVYRLLEPPRVTRPYTDIQWQQILALGDDIDQDLQDHDVRLTMGGEPTFVSIDDMDGEEWNTAALGDDKYQKALNLFKRLHDIFAKSGIPHFGQGKWYPGEPLPRWALTSYWRNDGVPLWANAASLDTEEQAPGHHHRHARQFAMTLAGRLGVNPEHVMAAYEDATWYAIKESQLPTDLAASEIAIDDTDQRRKLIERLDQGIGQPAGYVLPLNHDRVWQSSAWPLRRGKLFLTPGDSPIGYRLPLDSLPWQHPSDTFQPPSDPFQAQPALAHTPKSPASPPSSATGKKAGTQDPQESARVLHTALCIEAREGRLFVFLPPIQQLQHFVDLLHHLEQSANSLKLSIRLEGYAPPSDTRLQQFSVTPDPGVIEVNVQPAGNWRELVENARIIYQQARQNRLTTEKYRIDGLHTGTGGGNHVTIGGRTPVDSPLLRRPQLLRSLINYWQHHPALSYLFSGAFIGPTCQAPRVDEARDDNLYELEIAFQQLPDGDCQQPWIVDRVLRNLLVDVTGNTHRAEFCIDKLYAPEGPSGRRGLLELRAFEMPPHWQMSAVQGLLLRTLIAQFWLQPYREPLIRWGTELHDRFMLPHYVESDLRDIVGELRRWQRPFQLDWFEPFLAFRFPVLGRMQIDEMELELRHALEPWHVLGEELGTMGTSRFVDSSVERLQVKVKGMIGERCVLACNGRRVPLRATHREGEYVAGIRYKAWQPASGLHPTIGVHTPLVFDIIDKRNGHAIGGCTYHVAHPGGRSYDTAPVNAREAEGRRLARFLPQGHTPGPVEVPPEESLGEHPYTLDLRLQQY